MQDVFIKNARLKNGSLFSGSLRKGTCIALSGSAHAGKTSLLQAIIKSINTQQAVLDHINGHGSITAISRQASDATQIQGIAHYSFYDHADAWFAANATLESIFSLANTAENSKSPVTCPQCGHHSVVANSPSALSTHLVEHYSASRCHLFASLPTFPLRGANVASEAALATLTEMQLPGLSRILVNRQVVDLEAVDTVLIPESATLGVNTERLTLSKERRTLLLDALRSTQALRNEVFIMIDQNTLFHCSGDWICFSCGANASTVQTEATTVEQSLQRFPSKSLAVFETLGLADTVRQCPITTPIHSLDITTRFSLFLFTLLHFDNQHHLYLFDNNSFLAHRCSKTAFKLLSEYLHAQESLILFTQRTASKTSPASPLPCLVPLKDYSSCATIENQHQEPSVLISFQARYRKNAVHCLRVTTPKNLPTGYEESSAGISLLTKPVQQETNSIECGEKNLYFLSTQLKRTTLAHFGSIAKEIAQLLSKLPIAKQQGVTQKEILTALKTESFSSTIARICFKGHPLPTLCKMNIASLLQLFHAVPKLNAALSLLAQLGLAHTPLNRRIGSLSSSEQAVYALARLLYTQKKDSVLFVNDTISRLFHTYDESSSQALSEYCVQRRITLFVFSEE